MSAMSDNPATSSDPPPSAAPTPEQANDPQRTAANALLQLICGIHISRSAYAVAELGIADLLADGPLTSTELAAATATHEPSLYRVLRLLAALGVFDELESGRFGLTMIGERLRSEAPLGMRALTILDERLGGIRPFAHILETLRTGRSGGDIEFDVPPFERLAANPDAMAAFQAAMSERTAAFAPGVAAGYDFSPVRTVVDVGGGQGTLLLEILRRHAHLRGVLFELPTVVPRAQSLFEKQGLDDRCEVVAGDFFDAVPSGADCYLVANVLHDWDDERSIEILRNCQRAMTTGGRVLIVERLIPDRLEDAVPTLLSDINMLVLTGGKERTNAEYAALLAAADLTLATVAQVAFPYGVIDGYPA